jgi:hypothetical protein
VPGAIRPTRRDLLAGAAGGIVGVAAELGLDAIRGESKVPGGSADVPCLVGKTTKDLPSGLLRADVRAFKTGSGADYHQAFVDALDAAQAVYAPPGTMQLSRGITVPAGKVVYGDGALDQKQGSRAGAIVRLVSDIGSGALMTLGSTCEVRGITLDADGKADTALAIPKDADECRLWDVKAANGRSAACGADGSRLTIVGCLFVALKTGMFAFHCSGADLHVIAARMIGGVEATAWIDGPYGDYHVVHFQGANQTKNDARVTRSNNHFVQCRFDGGLGPNLLVQARGNKFTSCRFYNGQPGQSPSAVRIDGTSVDASQNEVADVLVDGVKGRTWKYLLEIVGSEANTQGTILGSGSSSFCDAPFSVRPAALGFLTNAGLTSRKEFRATLSGDGHSLTFTIPHGLMGTPVVAIVQPASADVAIGAPHVSNLGPTGIAVSFATAPPSGTNNLVFDVVATM